MLAHKEESCLAGTAVAAVLAKIAWSCADVERNLSSGRELPMRESQHAASERMETGINASRVAWCVDGWRSAERSTIFWAEPRARVKRREPRGRKAAIGWFVTVVSRYQKYFWNVVACPPRASQQVEGRSAGGEQTSLEV